MKNKIKIICGITFVFLLYSGYCLPQLRGAYGYNKDLRIRASHGVLPDRQLNNVAKIQDFNIEKILFAVLIPNRMELTYQPLLPTKLSKTNLKFDISNYAGSVLLENVDTTIVKAKLINSNDLKNIIFKTNRWNGVLKLEKSDSIDSILEKYDCDYMMVLIENGKIGDYIGGSRIMMSEPQGLYKAGNYAFVYAGFRIGIVDLSTKKSVRKGLSIQYSADFSRLPFKKRFEEYDSEQMNILELEIRERTKNNVLETLKLFGLKKENQ